jgi:hypothetical protein
MAPAQCDRSQRVFYFGKGKSEGDKSMKELVRSSNSFFNDDYDEYCSTVLLLYGVDVLLLLHILHTY